MYQHNPFTHTALVFPDVSIDSFHIVSHPSLGSSEQTKPDSQRDQKSLLIRVVNAEAVTASVVVQTPLLCTWAIRVLDRIPDDLLWLLYTVTVTPCYLHWQHLSQHKPMRHSPFLGLYCTGSPEDFLVFKLTVAWFYSPFHPDPIIPDLKITQRAEMPSKSIFKSCSLVVLARPFPLEGTTACHSRPPICHSK